MSKLSAFVAAGLAISTLASAAHANFIVTSSRQQNVTLAAAVAGTQTLGGTAGDLVDVVTFKIFNDGANGTGTKLFGIDLTFYSSSKFIFQAVDAVGDGPIQTVNTTANPNIVFGGSVGSYIRYGGASAFSPIYNGVNPSLGTFPENRQDPGNAGSTTFDARPGYTNLISFHVVGGILGGATAGLGGINLATLVVPHSATVRYDGFAGGDNGPNHISNLPEPASLATFSLAGLALLARRASRTRA